MVIASQIVSVLFSIFSRLQKTKTKSLILLLISNTINIISLILLDQAAGTFLTVATIIRTVIFFLYNISFYYFWFINSIRYKYRISVISIFKIFFKIFT